SRVVGGGVGYLPAAALADGASPRVWRGRAGDRGGMSRAETGAARLSVAARDPGNGAQAKRGVPRAPRRPRGPGRSRRARGDPPGLSGEARARLMARPRLPRITPTP